MHYEAVNASAYLIFSALLLIGQIRNPFNMPSDAHQGTEIAKDTH